MQAITAHLANNTLANILEKEYQFWTFTEANLSCPTAQAPV